MLESPSPSDTAQSSRIMEVLDVGLAKLRRGFRDAVKLAIPLLALSACNKDHTLPELEEAYCTNVAAFDEHPSVLQFESGEGTILVDLRDFELDNKLQIRANGRWKVANEVLRDGFIIRAEFKDKQVSYEYLEEDGEIERTEIKVSGVLVDLDEGVNEDDRERDFAAKIVFEREFNEGTGAVDGVWLIVDHFLANKLVTPIEPIDMEKEDTADGDSFFVVCREQMR